MGNEEYMRCPHCKSGNVAQGEKGFSLGKAAAGGALLGPLGLLAGTHGSKDVRFTCLDCGHRFSVQDFLDAKKADERLEALAQMSPEDRNYVMRKSRTAKIVALAAWAALLIFIVIKCAA